MATNAVTTPGSEQVNQAHEYLSRACAHNIRLNYVLWLQDLLDTTGDEYRDGYDPDRVVTGLDMYVPRASSKKRLI